MNPKVDEFLRSASNWQAEFERLRMILLDCQLTEELKWGQPCYTFGKNNIVIIGGFKEYCALLWVKGSLLSDPDGILIQPTENSQSGRQTRFRTIDEIDRLQATIKAYIYQAIEVEKAGLKVDYKSVPEFDIPEEFETILNGNATLKNAFSSLTPGRQKGYLLHFAGSKQSKTRTARIEKYIPRILSGKGINDCVCGLSKRMPSCDGSHKILKD